MTPHHLLCPPPLVFFSTPVLALQSTSSFSTSSSTFRILELWSSCRFLDTVWQKWLRLHPKVCHWVNESRDSRLPSNSRTPCFHAFTEANCSINAHLLLTPCSLQLVWRASNASALRFPL